MAFDLGSKFTRRAQQYVSDAAGRALPGNDPLSKIGRSVLGASGNRLIQAGLNFAGANIPGFSDVSASFVSSILSTRSAITFSVFAGAAKVA